MTVVRNKTSSNRERLSHHPFRFEIVQVQIGKYRRTWKARPARDDGDWESEAQSLERGSCLEFPGEEYIEDERGCCDGCSMENDHCVQGGAVPDDDTDEIEEDWSDSTEVEAEEVEEIEEVEECDEVGLGMAAREKLVGAVKNEELEEELESEIESDWTEDGTDGE